MEVGRQVATSARMTLLAVEIRAQKYVRVYIKCFQFSKECKMSQTSKHRYAYLLIFYIVHFSA